MSRNTLHHLIDSVLDDHACAQLVARLSSTAVGESVMGAFSDWRESDHPRDEGGRFSPSGSGRKHMTKSEERRWDNTGHSKPMSAALTKKRSQVARLEKLAEKFPKQYQGDLIQAQRQLAELERTTKYARRLGIEGNISKRILKKQLKEFQSIEDDIDYMEERYGDRENPFGGELQFPAGKKGQAAKKKYQKLCERREELKAEIEWDKVEDGDADGGDDDDDDDDHCRFSQVLGDATKHYLATGHRKSDPAGRAYEDAVRELRAMLMLKPLVDSSELDDPTQREKAQRHLDDIARQVMKCDEVLKQTKHFQYIK